MLRYVMLCMYLVSVCVYVSDFLVGQKVIKWLYMSITLCPTKNSEIALSSVRSVPHVLHFLREALSEFRSAIIFAQVSTRQSWGGFWNNCLVTNSTLLIGYFFGTPPSTGGSGSHGGTPKSNESWMTMASIETSMVTWGSPIWRNVHIVKYGFESSITHDNSDIIDKWWLVGDYLWLSTTGGHAT